MTHWRKMQDRNFLGAWSLEKDGKPVDVTLEIAKVEAAMVQSAEKPRGQKCPIVWFKNVKKPLVLNNTNGKTIESFYGEHVEEWIGKLVTLYATTTSVAGVKTPCVRVRSKRPAAGQGAGTVPNDGDDEVMRAQQKAAIAQSEAREPGSDDR